MAEVSPFKGILYNIEKVGKIADLVAPPYDVISVDEQKVLYERHKNNIIRLILGRKKANDSDNDNPHIRAANYFDNWTKDGVFSQDIKPCFYLEASEFSFEGEVLSRLGLIARVRIEPFEKKIIMPHENTFSEVKSERLGLIKASKMNFSCIFGLYPDKQKVFQRLLKIVNEINPYINFLNHDGLRHRLWKIDDKEICSFISESLLSERFIIADGHHRYETAMNYRNYLAKTDKNFTDMHPANYIMTYLSSMEDPGLIIRPTHRMFNVSLKDLEALLKKSSEFFEIVKGEYDQTLNKLKKSEKNSFILCIGSSLESYLFTLKSNVMENKYSKKMADCLMGLDVSVLTNLIFMDLLGFDNSKMDDHSSLGYISDIDEVVTALKNKSYKAAFILNPTKISQVKDVAENGLTMPRKSTFFYPKVVSGLVLNTLEK